MLHIDEHNQRQRQYFERSTKRRMVPHDTPYLNRHVDQMLRFFPEKASQRILEVGCGMGRYTLILWRRGLAVEGLDLSPILLERLRCFDADQHDYPLHCGDIAKPPEELTARYDLVVGFFVLHHLGDLHGGLAAMARLLKPGGRLLFLEPNAYNPLYYIQIMLTPGMSWRGERGIINMRPSVLIPVLQATGWRSVSLHRFGFLPPFATNVPGGLAVENVLERLPVRSLLPFQIIMADRG